MNDEVRLLKTCLQCNKGPVSSNKDWGDADLVCKTCWDKFDQAIAKHIEGEQEFKRRNNIIDFPFK